MSDVNRESLDLDDEDRLPWLESAEDYDGDGEYSPVRVALFVGAALLLLAGIVGGIYWLQGRDSGGLDGDGELIAAQEGNYKVRPDDPQAKQFEGEGDASFAASEGKDTDAKLGTDTTVETPVRKPETPNAPGSAMIQLGAYSTAAVADGAWPGFSNRFANIGALPKKIVRDSKNGVTMYKLNAVAPNANDAQQICNSLKAAGTQCMVVR